ncbi:hypothetical protein B9Q02_09255 [Candidatus Marsarchaeota G1 archaeon BE_D]|jgi:carbamate kinase|uniref:Carbamate kinase n=2 Tax=Candidatus Marsarchaeota group 1 TaxID=2203770 RepID=A0A2R6AE59_9ARCH|nr:MAG: hypothetical protein B9Q02_09255 [Candidatus Marsarchaeota G1 archaeon BE_D]PSN87343.1 MAG: hypothetical protein B9Q00_09110 [Candidatus Marsarchaeota G1 archaeon OSP_C]
MRKAVVALGGNALEDPLKGSNFDPERLKVAASAVDTVLQAGYSVAVTHGNGPQAGELLQALLLSGNPLATRLDIVVAMTQAQIGYALSQEIENLTKKRAYVVCTRVLVSSKDSAFQRPTKPIGKYYTEAEAKKLQSLGVNFKRFDVKGSTLYRQVVPSPEPLEIVEGELIFRMLEQGLLVVSCGGGGIPVVLEDGSFKGVNAVIDKDLASAKLAESINADLLLILTSVDYVFENYGKPNQRALTKLATREARKMLESGVFEEGSIAPKVLACTRFVEKTGKTAIITSLERVKEGLNGEVGTHFFKG